MNTGKTRFTVYRSPFTLLILLLLAALAPRAEAAIATGGTVTNYTDAGGTNWTAHIFTTVGSTSITFNVGASVEYLVVAGGGGGGNNIGGGGGGGGVRSGTLTVTAGSKSVTVGGGGAGGTNPGARSNGVQGADSVFDSITAKGGGYGGADGTAGGSGGSGGGGGGYTTGNGGTGTAGPPVQGYDGGAGDNAQGQSSRGGGGGGAGSVGASGVSSGNGGTGIVSSITGPPVGYAGGGGGGTYNITVGAAVDGGGAGAKYGTGGPSTAGTAGTDGRGGGGGGGSAGYGNGGKGGSGIVVVRYAEPTITVGSASNGFPDTFVNATNAWFYTISGSGLTNNLTVSVPSPSVFTISSNNVDYGSEVVLTTNATGAVPLTNIWVRFGPTNAAFYSAFITNSSPGAVTRTVQVTGRGLAATTPILTVTPVSLAFGNVITNKTPADQMFTVTGVNLTNAVMVSAPPACFWLSTNGAYFTQSPVTLATNGSGGIDITNIYVRFTPTAGQAYGGSIAISSAGAVEEKPVAVTGTGVVQTLVVSSASLNFGNVIKDTTSNLTYTVSGSNLESDVMLTVSGGTGFQIKTNGGAFEPSVTLAVPNKTELAGGTLSAQTITVQFAPTAVQTYDATVTASSTGAADKPTKLSGTGVVQQIGVLTNGVALTDGISIDFGSSAGGVVKTFTVTNSGGIALTLTGITKDGANPNEFRVGGTLPSSLAVGGSATFTLTFNPTASGERSAGVHIGNGTPDGSFDIALTGTGVVDPYLAFGGDTMAIVKTNGTTYGIHVFTNTGSATFLPIKNLNVDVLLVAGGGGGGTYGGGGGGGGVVYTSGLSVVAGAYTVVVGGGGAPNGTGTNSVFSNSVSSLIVAYGGGKGGYGRGHGGAGGSGGGAGVGGNGYTGGVALVTGQGFSGGASTGVLDSGVSGGGGGGGQAGFDSVGNKSGNGGSGTNYASFDAFGGSPPGWFAGGGGGGCYTDYTFGNGAANGGGGNGSGYNTPLAGLPNTGGGGGGGGSKPFDPQPGAAGGSGIVIIRYAILPPAGTLLMFR